jgi:pilus assembly protein CpaB
MNRRLLLTFLLAFVIAGACAFLVYRLIRGQVTANKPVASTRIVAAAEDIKIGSVLTANKLTTIQIQGTAPKGSFAEKDLNSLVNRGVIANLYQGEPILDSRLAPAGSGGGLAALIPQGMRASAVKVDDVVGVAGFVTPGARVDVIVSGTPPGTRPETEGTVAKTILQNLQVISAGTDIQKDAEGKPKSVQVVNLLVTPEEAETLNLASNQGAKIQLVLRNPMDTKIAEVPLTSMGAVFSGKSATTTTPVKTKPVTKIAHPAAPPPFTIEVINGSKRSVEKFASSEGQK